MYSGTMRKIFWLNRTGVSGSRTDIWILGVCYRVAQDDPAADPSQTEGYAAFVEDFSSRICITYRKGFAAIEDAKYTSDAGWGCMLRSSQMLIAQALLVHHLGRSWTSRLSKLTLKYYTSLATLRIQSTPSIIFFKLERIMVLLLDLG
ncbi:cysteine protease [Lithospermum erythrorhizon]|uniref:Cysteine protease n=1 Tax=Lithospermum erythrorhizon TaxID=34254 RepID=A0AAV3RZG2_LITER